MTERLLQYLWQYGYFNHSGLSTDTGEPVQILARGLWNHNEGPDFLDARVRIGPAVLAGSVELHLRTSDWDRHHHAGDPNYRNVILHVVYRHDRAGVTPGVPVLELEPHIPGILLERYAALMEQGDALACARDAASAPPLVWTAWKDRLVVERLLQKTKKIGADLEASHNNWEEVFWWLLARQFGVRVNAEAFEEVARSLPVSLLARHRGSIHKLEALLLGQANLLHGHFTEDYPLLLQREYRYLKGLYPLPPVHRAPHFLRMRPAAFPTVRLAQLAALLQEGGSLFTRLLEADNPSEVHRLFQVTANDYWHYHYRFEETSAFAPKKLGAAMIDTLLINVAVPVLFAYGHFTGDPKRKDAALNLLRSVGPEDNSVLRPFRSIGVATEGAADSQALIQLFKEYCSRKRCLECAVGNALLKRGL
ncbi:DUF2851 family protein [Flaviaesturariibacter amylovorans]|uniref:DUF2851 family protein n=1 Tax=Flaviaesturariibacter amylovorans TaxID=1084520 RepID=A0ABP8GUL2_9BACT